MLAYDIHEWNHDTMRLTEAGMAMVQVDGTKRQVLVELREFNKMQEILMTYDMKRNFDSTY
jgi:molybdopterin-guanine dinucleotide biosynthesis protein